MAEEYDPKLYSILMAKVDCSKEEDLCRRHHIQGYPSIRILRRGSDEHESYYGERDTESLLAAMETLAEYVPREVQTITHLKKINKLKRRPAPLPSGCKGWLQAKKVPGNIVFLACSETHSFDASQINMSHIVSHFLFGTTQSLDALNEMKRLTPYLGGSHDRLLGKSYIISKGPADLKGNVTIEHHLQLVMTELYSGNEKLAEVYEYTAHSNMLASKDVPIAKFHFEPSAMQVVVTEVRKSFSHFISNLCAIIGGVFTVVGILDAILPQKSLILKQE